MPLRALFVLAAFLGAALLHATPAPAEEVRWAIALHGGAGGMARHTDPQRVAAYHAALKEALSIGVAILRDGGTALDATERVVMSLEDCPLLNAGRGSVFDQRGGHAMDASIMDGRTLACGGVASVETLRNPIQGARIVMEQSPHVLLGGESADAYCAARGATVAPRNYFAVRRRFESLQRAMRKDGLLPPETPRFGWPAGESQDADADEEVGGTVGCVALDSRGALAAATSTGGRNNKLVGRIGDSPIPAAGNYANGAAAVGGTGKGEEYLRYFVTGRVAWLVESGSHTVDEAVRHVLEDILQPGDGGLIAVDAEGVISMRTNTSSMPHGAADSTGRFEVGIWFD